MSYAAAPTLATWDPPSHWLIRKITNSAGLTGAIPITVTTWPRPITSDGLVSSSHLTQNAWAGVRPISAPGRHRYGRKALASPRIDFHSVRSVGSHSIQPVLRTRDFSIRI